MAFALRCMNPAACFSSVQEACETFYEDTCRDEADPWRRLWKKGSGPCDMSVLFMHLLLTRIFNEESSSQEIMFNVKKFLLNHILDLCVHRHNGFGGAVYGIGLISVLLSPQDSKIFWPSLLEACAEHTRHHSLRCDEAEAEGGGRDLAAKEDFGRGSLAVLYILLRNNITRKVLLEHAETLCANLEVGVQLGLLLLTVLQDAMSYRELSETSLQLLPPSRRVLSRWLLSLVARNRQAEASVVPPGVTRTFLSVNTFFVFLERSFGRLEQQDRSKTLYRLVDFSHKEAFLLYGKVNVDVSLLGGTVQYVTRTYSEPSEDDDDDAVAEFRHLLLYFMFRIHSKIQQALSVHPVFCGSDVGAINPAFLETSDHDSILHKKSILFCTTIFSPTNSLLLVKFFNLLIDALNSLVKNIINPDVKASILAAMSLIMKNSADLGTPVDSCPGPILTETLGSEFFQADIEENEEQAEAPGGHATICSSDNLKIKLFQSLLESFDDKNWVPTLRIFREIWDGTAIIQRLRYASLATQHEKSKTWEFGHDNCSPLTRSFVVVASRADQMQTWRSVIDRMMRKIEVMSELSRDLLLALEFTCNFFPLVRLLLSADTLAEPFDPDKECTMFQGLGNVPLLQEREFKSLKLSDFLFPALASISALLFHQTSFRSSQGSALLYTSSLTAFCKQAIVTSAAFVSSRFERLCNLEWLKEDKYILGISRHKHAVFSKQAVAHIENLCKVINDALAHGSQRSSIVHLQVKCSASTARIEVPCRKTPTFQTGSSTP
eukprot:766727-Hanusia_phi.AAC.4